MAWSRALSQPVGYIGVIIARCPVGLKWIWGLCGYQFFEIKISVWKTKLGPTIIHYGGHFALCHGLRMGSVLRAGRLSQTWSRQVGDTNYSAPWAGSLLLEPGVFLAAAPPIKPICILTSFLKKRRFKGISYFANFNCRVVRKMWESHSPYLEDSCLVAVYHHWPCSWHSGEGRTSLPSGCLHSGGEERQQRKHLNKYRSW